jgi:hypothetical protein
MGRSADLLSVQGKLDSLLAEKKPIQYMDGLFPLQNKEVQ